MLDDELIVINAIKDNEKITMTELAKILGKSRQAVQLIINNLKVTGVVERIDLIKQDFGRLNRVVNCKIEV